MMEITNIKERVKKLLALSKDTEYDHESYVALQKAQELMAKYKLSQVDITDEEPKKCIRTKTKVYYGTRSSDHYLDDLASVIADNFCCINYVSTPKYSRTHHVCFMGLQEDVDIAVEALYIANTAIIKGYNKIYKELCEAYDMKYIPAYLFNPHKLGYVKGYISGLKSAFESQRKANQEWGLVLVVPKEAQEFSDSLETAYFGGGNSVVDRTYYQEGYADGSSFQLSTKIDTSGENKQID